MVKSKAQALLLITTLLWTSYLIFKGITTENLITKFNIPEGDTHA